MKYKFLEHTADVKIQAFGKSLEEAFENSALALKELMLDFDKIKIKSAIKKKIEVEGKDCEALLYRFLEEFLYLIDAKNFILSEIKKIKIEKEDGTFKLRAEIKGDRASKYKFSNKVKAVTYNDMFVKKKKSNFIIQFVVDV